MRTATLVSSLLALLIVSAVAQPGPLPPVGPPAQGGAGALPMPSGAPQLPQLPMATQPMILDGVSLSMALTNANLTLGNVSALEARYAALQARQATVQADLDSYWLIINGALVFLMQAGFALYEAGTVRATSQQGVFFKSVFVSSVVAITWWLFGFGLAYGDNSNSGTRNGFIGNGDFILVSDGIPFNARMYGRWFFEFSYAVIPTIICHGAVAERLRVSGIIVVSVIVSGFIYPVIAHWAWSTAGWVSPTVMNMGRMGPQGAFDFAGSGVVFLTGGACGLAATIAFGERAKRRSHPEQFSPRNKIFVTIGGFIIWFTAFSFMIGRSLMLSGPVATAGASVASKVLINAALGGVGGFLSGFTLYYLFLANSANININIIVDSILSGLVAVAAGVGVIEPWAGLVIGLFGGIFFFIGLLLIGNRHDDVLNGFSVYGLPGIWGLIAVGLFATSANVLRTYGNFGSNGASVLYYGLFYGGGGTMLWVQVVTAICIFGWTFFASLLLFKILSILPVALLETEQEKGTDSILYTEGPTAPDSFVDARRDAWSAKLAPPPKEEKKPAA